MSTYSNWLSWPTMLGALGSLAGLGSGIYSALESGRQSRQLERLARRPLDVDAYYSPMSEAAKQAFLRGVKANVAERGIQPGGYYDRLIGEALANTETARWNAALQAAQGARESQLRALMGRSAPPMVGSMDALGKALQWQATQRAQSQAMAEQRKWREAMERAMGIGPLAHTHNLMGTNPRGGTTGTGSMWGMPSYSSGGYSPYTVPNPYGGGGAWTSPSPYWGLGPGSDDMTFMGAY